MKTLGRHKTYFREWRKHRQMTLTQAAAAADMTAGNLSAMERGAQGYTQTGLEALADAYSCEPAHLLSVDPSDGSVPIKPLREEPDEDAAYRAAAMHYFATGSIK